jgi:hypothetical protein
MTTAETNKRTLEKQSDLTTEGHASPWGFVRTWLYLVAGMILCWMVVDVSAKELVSGLFFATWALAFHWLRIKAWGKA